VAGSSDALACRCRPIINRKSEIENAEETRLLRHTSPKRCEPAGSSGFRLGVQTCCCRQIDNRKSKIGNAERREPPRHASPQRRHVPLRPSQKTSLEAVSCCPEPAHAEAHGAGGSLPAPLCQARTPGP
jgi:hypothetical protein